MGFLTSLFGGSDNMLVTVLLSLGIVVVLIVVGVWLLKLLFNATANAGRGRARRLHIIESTTIDQKRRLVLIRRDNVEHLIMTGGAHDVVIEDGIAVPPPTVRRPARQPQEPAAQPAAQQPAAPVRQPAAARKQEPDTEPATARRRLAPGVAPQTLIRTDSTPDRRAPPVEPETEEVQPSDSRGPLDRLRELGRPLAERRFTSLRHTGLLRPVSRMEPGRTAPFQENTVPLTPDSDKSPQAAAPEAAAGEGTEAGDGETGGNTELQEDHKSGTGG